MKKRAVLIVFICALLTTNSVFAQRTCTLPLSERVTTGKLSNGMTYFIMHNEEPKNRASYYFAQNVGAILEEDSQNGLAHFLEHMAFNGLKHYPGKAMLNYLEKNGITFGRDINAFTAQDETVYNISNVQTDNDNLMDSVLLALHDWSGSLLLEDDEIEAERGVIHEEWRTRRNVNFRLMSKTNPVVLNHSKYADRDVIGSLDIIDHFKHQQLRDYYKKWYRPDQQAVIAVGDIDVAKTEQKIKDVFGKIPMPKNATEREYYTIEPSKEMGYVLATDKEAQGTSISWIFRHDAPKVNDEKELREGFVNYLFNDMFNNRLQELLQNPDAPALSLQAGKFSLTRSTDAGYLGIVPKEGKDLEAFEMMMTELEKIRRYGFTQSELDRAKVQLHRMYENYAQTYDKIDNDNWAKSLYNYFLKANDVLPLQYEIEFANKVMSTVTLKEIAGQLKWYQNINNSAITVDAPEKENTHYPTKEELLAIVDKVSHTDVEAYNDGTSDRPLISEKLKERGVVATSEIKGVEGAKQYVLENGIKVVLYPTELSKDEIKFTAFSPGGISLVDDEDLASGEMATYLAMSSGLGDFDMIRLQKKLTGKLAEVQPYIGETEEGFSGNGSAKDFETILQMVYLYFEHPRFDQKAFDRQINGMRNSLIHRSSDNASALGDTLALVSTNYSPRTLLFTNEYINHMDFDKAQAIYKDRIKDASDFTFVFVGNIDIEKDLPMVKKYLGNISSINRKEGFVDHKYAPAKGITQRIIEREMTVPKTTVKYNIYKNFDYNLENRIYINAVTSLLSKRYMETIREQEGGSYGVSVRPSLRKLPAERAIVSISFDCNPDKQERLLEIVKEEIDRLVGGTVELDDLKEIKEANIKDRKTAEESNGFWLAVISNSLEYNEPITSTEGYNAIVNGMDAKKIVKFAQKLFKNYDVVEVVMNPKK